MELRHLRYFVTVAEARSVSRAAERLAIAQPPLSQQIRRLEHELGFALFERHPIGVVLTRAGEALLPYARDVLRTAADAVAVATAAHRGSTGHLILGFINGAAYRILPDLLRTHRDSHPYVDVTVRELTIAEQVDALLSRHIDAGLLRPPLENRDLELEVLTRERFIIAMAENHAYAQRASLSLRDLHGAALVTYPYGQPAGFREQIDAVLKRRKIVPVVTQEAAQLHTLCGLAAAGVGLAIVPGSMKIFSLPGLHFKPLRDLSARAEIALAWRRGDNTPQIAGLVAAARLVAERTQSPPPPTPPASPASPPPRASRSAGPVPR